MKEKIVKCFDSPFTGRTDHRWRPDDLSELRRYRNNLMILYGVNTNLALPTLFGFTLRPFGKKLPLHPEVRVNDVTYFSYP